MNRGELRTMLRMRLRDSADAQDWSDAELNSRLNLGLVELQKKIIAVHPDAVLKRFRRSVVAGVDRYQWPAGFSFGFELSVLDATGTKYIPMVKTPLGEVRKFQNDGYAGDPVFAYEGRSENRPYGGFLIAPTPSTTVVDGFEASVMCALVMDDDTTIPAVDSMMHLAILAYAEDIGLSDTGEASDEVQKKVDRLIAGLPQYMLPSAQPDRLTIDGVVKDYV